MTNTQFAEIKALLCGITADVRRIADACERADARMADVTADVEQIAQRGAPLASVAKPAPTRKGGRK